MVALLLRLRLRQLANSLRRRPVQLLGMLLLLAVGVALTGYAVDTVRNAGAGDIAAGRTDVVLFGSVITLAFFLVPFMFGSDDALDPRALVTIGVTPLPVAAGLALASALTVPTVLLAVVAFAHAQRWAEHPNAGLVSTISAILLVVTGVLGSRVMRTLASLLLVNRRLRDVAGGFGSFATLAATPFVLVMLLGGDNAALSAELSRLARILAGSPLGFAWAAPADAAAGNGEQAWLRVLMALAFVAVLWLVWTGLVRYSLNSRVRAPDGEATRVGDGLGWFDWFPASEVGAIAARSITYWMRDGRYKFGLAAIPVVSLLVVVPFLVVGVWWQNLALVPLPVICLFLGWLLHNDLAHDGTALWLHIASNTSGWSDRLGRALPVIGTGIAVIVALAPVSTVLYGDWSAFPSLVGVSFFVLLAGAGISSYFSVSMPYAAVRPGASPFAQPQSSGSSAGQAVSFLLTVASAVPVLALGALGLAYGGAWPWLTLLAGIVVGLGVFMAGVAAGARVFSRRAPELLAFTLRN
jgi:ABC-2 type transport system permease protein